MTVWQFRKWIDWANLIEPNFCVCLYVVVSMFQKWSLNIFNFHTHTDYIKENERTRQATFVCICFCMSVWVGWMRGVSTHLFCRLKVNNSMNTQHFIVANMQINLNNAANMQIFQILGKYCKYANISNITQILRKYCKYFK